MSPVTRKRKCEEPDSVQAVKKSKPTPKAQPKFAPKPITKPTRIPPVRSCQKKQDLEPQRLPPKPTLEVKPRQKQSRPPRQKTALIKATPAHPTIAQDRSNGKESKTRVPQQPPPPAPIRAGKRKRDTQDQDKRNDEPAHKRTKKVQPQEPTPEDSPSKVSRLTVGNLRALTMANGDMGPPPRPAVQGYRDPLREIDLNSVTSGSDAKTACTLPQQREKEQLDAHHIYSYRDVPIPNGMQALIVSITSPFPEGADDGNAEKLGQGIAKMWLEYREMAELKGQEVLKDWLGYRGYDEKSSETFQPGEQHISRDYNKLWRRKCCPIRSVDENHDEYYELVSSGTPPTPKPDIMYGYNDSAFGIQTRHLRRWNSLLVTNKAPWFPYWVIQWKTSINAGVQQAAIQARRDGSAATAALHEFYCCHDLTQPGPEKTAMFSLLIDSEIAYLNVHWRRTDPLTMDVSYEMTLIEQFFISKAKDMTCLRRMIWKMLGWARETRLNQIRNLIRQSHRAVPLKKDKPKQSARATSSQASSVRGSSRQSLTTNDRLQIEREAEQRVLKKIHEKRPDVDLSGIDLEEDPIINGVDEHRTESLGSHRSSTVKGRSTRGRSQIATEGAPSKRRRVH